MKAALSSLLTYAHADEIIDFNPALQVGRKKRRAGSLIATERTQKIRSMSWEQRNQFLEAAAAERPYAALFATLAKAGLLPGEAFALEHGDLDVHQRMMRVERAVNLGRVKETKDPRDEDRRPDP